MPKLISSGLCGIKGYLKSRVMTNSHLLRSSENMNHSIRDEIKKPIVAAGLLWESGHGILEKNPKVFEAAQVKVSGF
jgi:hypothetical protein